MKVVINATSKCNLACSYCFEGADCGDSTLFQSHTEVEQNDLFKFLKSFPENELEIDLWGGEPMMNWKFCYDIINTFREAKFKIYTNGTYIKKHLNSIKELYSNGTMMMFQVSYDGKLVTDRERVDKKGNPTSEQILEGYNLLKENGIPTFLKATITPRNYKFMYESFVELVELVGAYVAMPDTTMTFTDEELKPYLKDLAVSLEKVNKYIIEKDLVPEKVMFWYNPQGRGACTIGRNHLAVDLNGDIHPCKAAFYEHDEMKPLANINQGKTTEEIKDLVEDTTTKFQALPQPLECQSCDVLFCAMCMVANLNKSKKTDLYDKLTDNLASANLCQTFKLVDVYHKQLKKELNK